MEFVDAYNIKVPKDTVDFFNGDLYRASIFIDRYAMRDKDRNLLETVPFQMWQRVALAVSDIEGDQSSKYFAKFSALLEDFTFVPGGRILHSAGNDLSSTTQNCFVYGIDDDRSSIFDTLKYAVETQARGGGCGFNFSNIRPHGALVRSTRGIASGPVTFMNIYNQAFKTIQTSGSRNGANMGILNINHPDIQEFITCKTNDPTAFTMFNISVGVTNDFLDAVKYNNSWDLEHKESGVRKTVKARELWSLITESAWKCGDPGVINLDTLNSYNPGNYIDYIEWTNPCAEVTLVPGETCCLGSLNLTKFFKNNQFGFTELDKATRTAIRFLDNVLDLPNTYPYEINRQVSQNRRRIGLGTIGFADLLLMCGLRYGSDYSLVFAENIMKSIRDAAYDESINLAKEKGKFPLCNPDLHGKSKFIEDMEIGESIGRYGIRNIALLAQAPTGTISALAGVSSGIEPNYAFTYERHDNIGNSLYEHPLYKKALKSGNVPDYFVDAHDVNPIEHLRMLQTFQHYVDNSVSKTINFPNYATVADISAVYEMAMGNGVKALSVFRDGCKDGVLKRIDNDAQRESIQNTGTTKILDMSDISSPTEQELREDEELAESEMKEWVTGLPARPQFLEGRTYKVKVSDVVNYYITINHTTDKKLMEVFINTKDPSHSQWTSALGTLISSIMRREPDVSFMIEDLESIQSPTGGVWADGGYIPSIPAAVGRTIRAHLNWLNPDIPKADTVYKYAIMCTRCSHGEMIRDGSCYNCHNCGYSTCS